ncbi:MAG TPA: hypothetical protein VG248_00725 [Caulobacteraceae bacterium]|jgi:hypothetical protein|nr:hypothetical protein [Caulobacteraceae bacterium]
MIPSPRRPLPSLLAYEDYERLRDQERQTYLTVERPADLAEAILEDLDQLRAPGPAEDGDITG